MHLCWRAGRCPAELESIFDAGGVLRLVGRRVGRDPGYQRALRADALSSFPSSEKPPIISVYATGGVAIAIVAPRASS